MRIFRICLIIILMPSLAQATELSVFAASSLTEGLREVAQAYQAQRPDIQIRLHFAGSQALATQIEQGAPSDLFIAANLPIMERLVKNGLVEKSRLLLHNRLILAVQPDLIPQPTSIEDLARPGLLLAIGNRQVPIGRYTRKMLAGLADDPTYGPGLVRNIQNNIVSEENKVKAIVAKLLLGEVDAGIVYRTDLDAENSRKLTAITLPQNYNPRVGYPVAKVTAGQADADDFIAFLFKASSRQIFIRQGFMIGDGP